MPGTVTAGGQVYRYKSGGSVERGNAARCQATVKRVPISGGANAERLLKLDYAGEIAEMAGMDAQNECIDSKKRGLRIENIDIAGLGEGQMVETNKRAAQAEPGGVDVHVHMPNVDQPWTRDFPQARD
jgi:hypothetical protein